MREKKKPSSLGFHRGQGQISPLLRSAGLIRSRLGPLRGAGESLQEGRLAAPRAVGQVEQESAGATAVGLGRVRATQVHVRREAPTGRAVMHEPCDGRV